LEHRNILMQPGESLANALIPIGTSNGRRSVFLEIPGLDQTGKDGDFTAVPIPIEGSIYGHQTAIDAWLVAGNHASISDVFIGGVHLVKDQIHQNEKEILQNAASCLTRPAMNQHFRS
jgi:hypothetical protein